MHGKTSWIRHQNQGVMAGLANPFEATRYHSLIVERATLPDVLEVTAETEDGVIMGLRHRHHPIEGVQFHPESILTSVGKELLANFLGAVLA
jgi:anthranilate synthase/aminodeoxychorismate synthase-like glutamine amidotransferase